MTMHEQLSRLALPAAPAGLSLRAMAAAERRLPELHRARRPARATAIALTAGAIFVGANVVVAEQVPEYRRVLATLPFVAQEPKKTLNERNGLAETDVTPLNDVVVANGYEVRVIGVYADTARTTVNVAFKAVGANDPLLTRRTISTRLFDAEGNSVETLGFGVGGKEADGAYSFAINFEALGGAAASGAQFTFVVKTLSDYESGIRIDGDWSFTLSLQSPQVQASEFPLPDPIRTSDGTVITVSRIVATGNTVFIDWRAVGPFVERQSVSHQHQLTEAAGAARNREFWAYAPRIEPIANPAGAGGYPGQSGGGGGGEHDWLSFRTKYTVPGPGKYRLLIGPEEPGLPFTMILDIP